MWTNSTISDHRGDSAFSSGLFVRLYVNFPSRMPKQFLSAGEKEWNQQSRLVVLRARSMIFHTPSIWRGFWEICLKRFLSSASLMCTVQCLSCFLADG